MDLTDTVDNNAFAKPFMNTCESPLAPKFEGLNLDVPAIDERLGFGYNDSVALPVPRGIILASFFVFHFPSLLPSFRLTPRE